jgi:hypothetical protein
MENDALHVILNFFGIIGKSISYYCINLGNKKINNWYFILILRYGMCYTFNSVVEQPMPYASWKLPACVNIENKINETLRTSIAGSSQV